MEKRRVRIYKAGGEQGAYVNSMAQFLNRAQEGGMPDVNEMGYQDSQEQTEVSEQDLSKQIAMDINNEVPKETIVMKLVNIQGLDPIQATQYVEQMYQNIGEDSEEEIVDEELVDGEEVVNEEEVNEEEEVVEEPQMQVPEFEQEPVMSYNDLLSQEIVNEDNQEEDLGGYEEDLLMQYGGSAMLTQDFSAEQTYKEGGAYKKDKRLYIKSVLDLVKKELGGSNAVTEESTPDPTGSNVRNKNLSKFVSTLQNKSTMAIAKEKAEQEFEQLQQQMWAPEAEDGGEQNIYKGQDNENPMHHLALFSQSLGNTFQDDQNQTVRSQVGGFVDADNPNLSRFVYGGDEEITQSDIDFSNSKDTTDPNFPKAARGGLSNLVNTLFPASIQRNMQSIQSGYAYDPMTGQRYKNFIPNENTPVTSVTVNKKGIFGKPKKYTVNYGNTNNQMINSTAKDRISLPTENKSQTVPGTTTTNKPTVTNPIIPDTTKMSDSEKMALMNKKSKGGINIKKYQTAGQTNTPIAYNTDPAMKGLVDVGLEEQSKPIAGLEANPFWANQQSFNPPTPNVPGQAPDQYKIDEKQTAGYMEKIPGGNMAIDFDNRNTRATNQAYLEVANAGITSAMGMVDRKRNKKNEAKMYDKLHSDGIVASTNIINKGNDETNSGNFRPNEAGSKWTSSSKSKYGGSSNGYNEGDEVEMSEEELADFIAAGGEIY
jgi:hypothetical protein